VYAFSYIFFDSSLHDENIKRDGTDFMNYFMHEIFMKFLLLLNTKGVTTETISPSKALNKKRKKRKKYPIREFKVLKFQFSKNRRTHESTRGDSIMPLHSVIGHVKIYNKSNPLFGHYNGSVWCPSHFRGDINKGIVKKDYKLTQRKKDE
jgi:hypothetical protein